jgi:glycosyltransferase involved in cell wall biosynthesis
LESLSFADEIVVVLDKCTDRSKEIAQSYSAKLIEGSWEIEGPRRNTGIDACTSDWILEVDADERVTKRLAEEILRLIQTSKNGYFHIPLHNYIGNK